MRTIQARRAMPHILLVSCVLLAACSMPEPPDEKQRPEPQAGPKSAIVQNANAYKDRVRDAQAEQEAAEDRQRAEIDAQSQ